MNIKLFRQQKQKAKEISKTLLPYTNINTAEPGGMKRYMAFRRLIDRKVANDPRFVEGFDLDKLSRKEKLFMDFTTEELAALVNLDIIDCIPHRKKESSSIQ